MKPVLTIPFIRRKRSVLTPSGSPLICTAGAQLHGIPPNSKGELHIYKCPVEGSQEVVINRNVFNYTTCTTSGRVFGSVYYDLECALADVGLFEYGNNTYYMKVIHD